MIGAGIFRGEQQKHKIDRLAVERFEIDGFFEPGENAVDAAEFRQLAVRDRDAIPDAGRAETLPLQEDFENFPAVLPVIFAACAESS